MALASMTRSPFVPLTLKSGSRTPHGTPRRDIAAVPTAWKTLHPTSNVSTERGMIQGVNIPGRVVPGVLSDLLIRVRGSQGLPRSFDEPFPSPGGGESFSEFDGGDQSLDVEVSSQRVGIDNRRIEWICAHEFDLSTCPKVMKVRRSRERGETRTRGWRNEVSSD